MGARQCRQLLLCLGWYLLALPSWCAAQVTLPATVEVDLIFPRNDTYAPVPLMPIVFAIQNPQVAASLNPGFHLEVRNIGNDSLGFGVDLHTGNANFSGSDPYLFFYSTSLLNNTEGTWLVSWDLSTRNCSDGTSGGGQEGQLQHKSVQFTTKNGAQQPDLAAATSDSTCAATEGFTFNITDIVPYVEHPDGAGVVDHRNSCAVLSPTLPPAPQPCQVKIDAAAASSISANISLSACLAEHPFSGICTSSGGVRFWVDGAILFLAAFPLMLFLL